MYICSTHLNNEVFFFCVCNEVWGDNETEIESIFQENLDLFFQ